MRTLAGSPLLGVALSLLGGCGGDTAAPPGPPCDQSTCGPRQECDGPHGMCVTVECGSYVNCEDSADICDTSQGRCFPANGACLDGGLCPTFGILRSVSIACGGDGLCHATEVGAALPAPVAATATISVAEPTAGSVFAAPQDIRVSWAATNTPTIVEILDDGATDQESLTKSIIWGSTLSQTAAPVVTWSEGHAVNNGSWAPKPQSSLTTGPYFVFVQAVDHDDLIAASVLIPIWVGTGAPWKNSGDSCSHQGVPGDCVNPARPQACFAGACAEVCASFSDCAPMTCQSPVDGYRVCQ